MKNLFKEKIENNFVFFGWILLSLIVTIYSKWLMNIYFPYPTIMSGVHMLMAFILSHLLPFILRKKEKNLISNCELNYSEKKSILKFSFIVALNIWISNASLFLASISLHQVARTTIPLFTMLIGILFFNHKYSLLQLPPVLLVIIGVSITVNGTPELTFYGLSIVFFGCCISSLKGIVAQKLQMDSIKIGPISMLQYVAPIASITLFLFAIILGETKNLFTESKNMDKILTIKIIFFLIFAGLLAFLLNILSFKSSSIVSPLAMNIAGNVKQLLTCIIGCFIFGNSITEKLLIGIFLTTIGAVWYSFTKQNEINQKRVKYVKGRYMDRINFEENMSNIKKDLKNHSGSKKNENLSEIETIELKDVDLELVNNTVNELNHENDLETEFLNLELIHEDQHQKNEILNEIEEEEKKKLDNETDVIDKNLGNKMNDNNNSFVEKSEEINKENFTENFIMKMKEIV